MAAERKTIQELIEEGRSTTESLLSHANYAEAMICSRKTLDTLVRSLCRRNNLPDGDLTDKQTPGQKKNLRRYLS